MNLEKKYKISPISILRKINYQLDLKRKSEIKLVVVLSFLSSIAESISIALLIPFISFFISPETYSFNKFFNFFFSLFDISSKQEILTVTTFFFIFAIILSGIIRINYIKLSNRITDNIASDFRIKIFNFLLNQEYSYYFKYGSQEILSNLTQKTSSFAVIIFSTINILNAILISSSIILVLTINEPIYTPIIIITIISFFYAIFKLRSSLVINKAENVNINQNKIIDIFENTVGYLPEIILYNLKKSFMSYLSKVSSETAKHSSDIRIIGQTPKIYLEIFVLIFVILLVFFSNIAQTRLENNITYLAVLAFGAQKTLPLVFSIYNLSINFRGSTPNVVSFLQILENKNYLKYKEFENNKIKKLPFKEILDVKKISFMYDNQQKKIIDSLSCSIKRGEKVTIKGKTGSGKSTLISIIAGLLDPQEGKILVDGKEININNKIAWQKNIAYVPQSVFLNDASILENIAIGVDIDKINKEKIEKAAKDSQIDSFVKKLPNKYLEKVGEKGIRLSGGQRQRIGIARALYRDAEIIILDEPTNALDKDTEKLVMDSISNLGKDITLIMISHSNNLLKYFDKIIDLDLHE